MSTSTGAVSSGRRGYSQLPAARPQREETNQGLSTREKMCMGALVLLVLVVNETCLGFEICVDDVPDPLLFKYRINTDEEVKIVNDLVAKGYLTRKPTGDGFNPTMKFVDSLPTDQNLAELLRKLGIDPDPEGLESESCKVTLVRYALDVWTAHDPVYCSEWRQTVKHRMPCALLEEQQQESPRGKNTTRVLSYLGRLITGANGSSSTREKKDTRFLDYHDWPINGANHSS